MDRLMAMYQAAKPDTFIQPLSSVATFANPHSQLDTIDTPLYPFRHLDGSFWTSQDVSSASTIFPLSYGYPEVPCLMTFTTFDALRNHTTTEINRLYAPKPAAPTKRSVTTSEIRKEWQAKVTVDQAELQGTFIVYFFFGKPPSESSEWSTSVSMIGSFTRLGSPGVRMHSEIIGNNVILTDALHKTLGVSSTEDQIIDFIKHNLTWMILSDNEPVDITGLTTLKIACVSTEVVLPVCGDQLPQRGRDTYHLKATAGKPGGAASECDLKRSHK
ncbi:Tyrosinase [Orbilia brochopaga]|nr:Tyrosinase [Drechslerella brochopaga]